MPKIKDITGQQFGLLTVINFAGMKNHRAMWHCRCQCGNEKDINGTSLRLGKSQSCGCRPNRNNYSHPHDLSGQRFGDLEVLHITDKRTNNGNVIWRCKCLACGKEVDISSHTLVVGHANSCGCIHSKGERKIIDILSKNNPLFKGIQANDSKDLIICLYETWHNIYNKPQDKQVVTNALKLDKGIYANINA